MGPVDALSRALVERHAAVGEALGTPAIAAFELAPEPRPDGRRNNFGFLRLTDGTVGLTYVALDGAREGLARALPGLELAGRSPLEFLPRFADGAPWERALGLAAINAIAQHALARSGPAPAMPDNLELLGAPGRRDGNRPDEGRRVGMVGHFGRLVGPLVERGVELTVVELDPALARREPGLEVTLDPVRLAGCEAVAITGTTLLNGTLGRLLARCAGAREVHLLGPSASCLPEVPFAAGATSIGGFRVDDPDLFARRWREGGRWRDAGVRYLIRRDAKRGGTRGATAVSGARDERDFARR